MKVSRSTDHVISDANDGGAFKCLHCRARLKVELPVNLSEYAAAGKEFLKRHAGCAKQEEGPHGR